MSNPISLALQPFSYWLKKNWYYHKRVKNFYQLMVPEDSRVLHIGAKNGYVLQTLQPSIGVGFDTDNISLQEGKVLCPEFQFVDRLSVISIEQPFEYIIVSCVTMELDDVQYFLQSLHPFCDNSTRIIIDNYSILWEPVLWATQKLGLRRPTRLKNWIAQRDLINFLQLASFDIVTRGVFTLLPYYIPVLSTFINKYIAWLPIINWFCLQQWVVARKTPKKLDSKNITVSVIIPCKNEKGNVESAILNCSQMGKQTEFIFVDGHSKDGTFNEMQRVKAKYPEKNISCFKQTNNGKGDAVRLGFAKARGDIVMILDGDITTPPEEMYKFFDALVAGKGECINGSRLVYGMENQAMRFLNMCANYGFGVIFSWLLGQRIKDTLCGTKVLWKKDYERIAKHRAFFGEFDPFGDFDLLFGAARLNLKIIDMPVHYKNRQYGVTQISRFKHGFMLLGMSIVACKKFKWW